MVALWILNQKEMFMSFSPFYDAAPRTVATRPLVNKTVLQDPYQFSFSSTHFPLWAKYFGKHFRTFIFRLKSD